MKGKFDAYVRSPLQKELNVDQSTPRNVIVYDRIKAVIFSL